MNNKILLSLLAMIMLLSWPLLAQEDEPGGFRAGFALDKDISKKITVSGDAEIRTLGFGTTPERFSYSLGLSYDIDKHFSVAGGYEHQNVRNEYYWGRLTFLDANYMIVHQDSSVVWMQPRHRVYVQAGWKEKLGDFTLSVRQRVQTTFKDDKSRIVQNGDTNFARINPDISWRNKIQLSYNIPHFKLTPSLAFESYLLMSDPDLQKYFNKLRSTLSLEYKLNKRNYLEVFGIYSFERSAYEVKVSGPNYYTLGIWYPNVSLGVGYKIKL